MKIDLKELRQEITSGKVVLLFTASWCLPCESLKKEIDSDVKLYKSWFGDSKYYEVDVQENIDVSNHFGIGGIPTLMVFDKDLMLLRETGIGQETSDKWGVVIERFKDEVLQS